MSEDKKTLKKLEEFAQELLNDKVPWHERNTLLRAQALENGLISKSAHICPIKSSQYKTLASRPSYSVLNCSETYEILKFEPPNWKSAIIEIIKELKT